MRPPPSSPSARPHIYQDGRRSSYSAPLVTEWGNSRVTKPRQTPRCRRDRWIVRSHQEGHSRGSWQFQHVDLHRRDAAVLTGDRAAILESDNGAHVVRLLRDWTDARLLSAADVSRNDGGISQSADQNLGISRPCRVAPLRMKMCGHRCGPLQTPQPISKQPEHIVAPQMPQTSQCDPVRWQSTHMSSSSGSGP